jgi:hypothetical protein
MYAWVLPTIEKLSCMYLATHARCGGIGTAIMQALQGDGQDILGIYRLSAQIKI